MSCEYGPVPKFNKAEENPLKKVSIESNPAFPKNAELLIDEKNNVRGILTTDGSFDLTPEGAKFLGSKDRRIENAGITVQGIFINAD